MGPEKKTQITLMVPRRETGLRRMKEDGNRTESALFRFWELARILARAGASSCKTRAIRVQPALPTSPPIGKVFARSIARAFLPIQLPVFFGVGWDVDHHVFTDINI